MTPETFSVGAPGKSLLETASHFSMRLWSEVTGRRLGNKRGVTFSAEASSRPMTACG